LGERGVRNAEVRGSIPLRSTSLRSASFGSASRRLDETNGAERGLSRRSASWRVGGLEQPMKYVYILHSISFSDRYYTGITDDLKKRSSKHNAKEVPHTSKYAPWQLKTYIAFSDETQAFAFERYLKTASGRAFAKKRL
jgi:putative endonuclease